MKNVVVNSNVKKVKEGVWTPFGEILCYECNGGTFKNVSYNRETKKFEDKILPKEDFELLKQPIDIRECNSVTSCDKCGCNVQLNASTAQEHNLYLKLKENGVNALMTQTGGMNSAVELERNPKGFIWITYDIFGEEEVFKWYLGVYDDEGAYEDECFLTTDIDEMISYVIDLKNKKLIK